MKANTQLMLLDLSGDDNSTELAEQISQFRRVNRHKDGDPAKELLGVAMTLGKRADLGKSLGLKGDKLNEAILELTDAALKGIKMEVAGMGDEVTAHNTPVTRRKLADGRIVTTYKVVTVDRDETPDEDEIVDALSNLSDEQRMALLEKAEAKAAESKATEIESTVSDAAPVPQGEAVPA